MLYLVISEPRPEPPSGVATLRQRYWTWVQPLIDAGLVRSVHARVGRGAVVLFDVDSHETLHRLLNEWADIIPARFDIFPLIEPAAARHFLHSQTSSVQKTSRKPSARSKARSSTGRGPGGRGREKPITSS
jgi:muconolactone delta-isomerase